MEWGVPNFWDWFPTWVLQDPMDASLNSYTLIFWEIDFANYVNYEEFGKNKTQGILGIKLESLQIFLTLGNSKELLSTLPKTF